MKINRIHHVAIICSDYEKSKAFYVNILGCEIVHELCRDGGRSFKLDLSLEGEYQIELFSFPDAPPRLSYPEACGLRHMAFEVDDIDEAITVLRSWGVTVEDIRIDEVTGKKLAFFFDPDGLPLELQEK